jgi:hypothetical protein
MKVQEDWRYCPHCELPGLRPEGTPDYDWHICVFCLRDERDKKQ